MQLSIFDFLIEQQPIAIDSPDAKKFDFLQIYSKSPVVGFRACPWLHFKGHDVILKDGDKYKRGYVCLDRPEGANDHCLLNKDIQLGMDEYPFIWVNEYVKKNTLTYLESVCWINRRLI